ncbi:MAG TPA: RecX family transcriptional regulator [Candidatus Coprenecus stercoravium]|uniref:Regulatory protein RecX n=1 Tax=Candidatus Coprenecus stercoravium TaxID=2840735 RepID=A0A9D2GRC2_9BACT|nr:RecX family transcriptional regulator [Candidatus Coprenecus stercoravium]
MSTSDTTSNPDTVFSRMAWLCSRREYCSSAVLQKIRQKGLDGKEAAAVLDRLVRERYVDDARYARAFVRDKALLSGWGQRKIAFALSVKGISKDIVEAALREVSPEDSEARMRQVLSAKWKSVSGKTLYERRTKLLRFALSRGYQYDDVMRFLDALSE